jgi:RHS repeat-associated protein
MMQAAEPWHRNDPIATVPIALRNGSNADTGAVKLLVNGAPVATYSYGANDTPSTVAEGLAAASSSSLVTVKAVDNALYIEATPAAVSAYTGAGTDFSYTIQNAGYNTSGTNYTYPSFPASPITGSLDGGSTGSSGSNPVTVYSFAGSYDGVSNLASYTDSVMGSWNFSYDTLNRLVSSQNTAVSSATPQFAGNYGCWSYDGFGNRLSQAMSTTACGSSPPLMSWANYNSNNQFTATSQALGGVPYDASGDVLNDGQNQYLYDGEGRICAVASSPVPNMTTMTGYLYDADGTRVAKGSITAWSCDPGVNGFQTTNDYILGPGGQQAAEMGVGTASSANPASDSNSALTWQHTNVYAGGALIATYDNDGLHFYFNDPLGTRRAQTDYAGVLEQTCSSLPFGDGLSCSGGNLQAPTEHHFTGKERDTESGNDYFGARYYASSMGTWMSPDPSGLFFGDPTNPQSFNLYSYVQNRPLYMVDPDGLQSVPDMQCHPAWLCHVKSFFKHLFSGPPGDPPSSPLPPSGPSWQRTPPTSGHYVTMSFWPAGAGWMGHYGIGLDTPNDTWGFATKNHHHFIWYLTGVPFKGDMHEDMVTYQGRDTGLAAPRYLYMSISDDAYEAMSSTMSRRFNHPGWYHLYLRNCAQFDEDLLHAGQIPGVPHHEIFEPRALRLWLLMETGP